MTVVSENPLGIHVSINQVLEPNQVTAVSENPYGVRVPINKVLEPDQGMYLHLQDKFPGKVEHLGIISGCTSCPEECGNKGPIATEKYRYCKTAVKAICSTEIGIQPGKPASQILLDTMYPLPE